MDKSVLKNTAERLNIYEESVIKKTEEYLRLYQIKASGKALNDQVKTVLCLDLATQSLGKGFDKEVAHALCGFKRSVYQKNLYTIEKVLGLDRTLNVSDVCVQLGCTVVKEDAENILAKYQEWNGKIKDLEHPQYVAAATYLACNFFPKDRKCIVKRPKARQTVYNLTENYHRIIRDSGNMTDEESKKVSIDKSKIVSISRIRPSQWKELLSKFQNLGLEQKSVNSKAKENVQNENNEILETQPLKQNYVEEIEEYEVWKKRVLDESYAAIEQDKRIGDTIILE